MSTHSTQNNDFNNLSFLQRLLVIIQLCLAFSLMLWYVAQPFMGEYFTLRSRMLLYEYAMGTSEILKNRYEQTFKLERQAQRFKQLPKEEQHLLKQDYQNLHVYAKRSVLKKIEDGIKGLISDIPPFEQAWIFFTIFIAILILLKIDGAKQAAWLLPLIVIAYAWDNQLTGTPPPLSPDHSLFPTEKFLVQHYLKDPLSSNFLEQKQQLEKSWNHYLIQHWSSFDEPTQDALEEAEFQFTLARLHLLHDPLFRHWLGIPHQKLGWISLIGYFLWNVLFAWTIHRSMSLKHLTEMMDKN